MEKLKKELQENRIIKEKSDEKSYKDFIERNALAKVGDVVTDGRTPIFVKKIWYDNYGNNSAIVYEGVCATFDNKKYRPFKKSFIGYAHQFFGVESKMFKVLYVS